MLAISFDKTAKTNSYLGPFQCSMGSGGVLEAEDGNIHGTVVTQRSTSCYVLFFHVAATSCMYEYQKSRMVQFRFCEKSSGNEASQLNLSDFEMLPMPVLLPKVPSAEKSCV